MRFSGRQQTPWTRTALGCVYPELGLWSQEDRWTVDTGRMPRGLNPLPRGIHTARLDKPPYTQGVCGTVLPRSSSPPFLWRRPHASVPPPTSTAVEATANGTRPTRIGLRIDRGFVRDRSSGSSESGRRGRLGLAVRPATRSRRAGRLH